MKKTTEPDFYTIDTVPAPAEPMGDNMQHLAAKLDEMFSSWADLIDEEPNDEEPTLTLDDIFHIAAARLASMLNQ